MLACVTVHFNWINYGLYFIVKIRNLKISSHFIIFYCTEINGKLAKATEATKAKIKVHFRLMVN